MQKFHFSLESALQLRQIQVDLQRARLETLFGELHSLESQERQLITDQQAADSCIKTSPSSMSLSLMALDAFNRHVGRQQNSLERSRVDCLNRIAAQQQSVVQARRDHELLVKVKERRKTEWQYAVHKEEEELAGEVFLAKWSQEHCA